MRQLERRGGGGVGIINRTYGIHKNSYIYLFLLITFSPIYYGPPHLVDKSLEKMKRTRCDKTSRLLCTGDYSKWDQILFVKIAKCIGFCAYRRSYLIWSSVLVL